VAQRELVELEVMQEHLEILLQVQVQPLEQEVRVVPEVHLTWVDL
jgi:hypothetical protein